MKIKLIHMIAISMFATAPFSTYAAGPSDMVKERAEVRGDMHKDAAKMDYKEAKMRCKTMKGDAEDICLKDARAIYKSEVANAKADEKVAKTRANAAEESNEAMYKSARERCKSHSGNTQDKCIDEAKMKFYQ